MPSIFSIGFTLSRTMPSMFSSSLRRNSDWRAGVGEHVLGLVEQLLRFGLDRRTDPLGVRGDAGLLGLFLRDDHFDRLAPRAISLSRTVVTRSGASVARAWAVSASACAANSSSDF